MYYATIWFYLRCDNHVTFPRTWDSILCFRCTFGWACYTSNNVSTATATATTTASVTAAATAGCRARALIFLVYYFCHVKYLSDKVLFLSCKVFVRGSVSMVNQSLKIMILHRCSLTVCFRHPRIDDVLMLIQLIRGPTAQRQVSRESRSRWPWADSDTNTRNFNPFSPQWPRSHIHEHPNARLHQQ